MQHIVLLQCLLPVQLMHVHSYVLANTWNVQSNMQLVVLRLNRKNCISLNV